MEGLPCCVIVKGQFKYFTLTEDRLKCTNHQNTRKPKHVNINNSYRKKERTYQL